jgi:hypothetical protein
MRNKIGIVLLATNAYFVLGVRFIKKFRHYYKGDAEVTFFFFSEEDPNPYIPTEQVKWYKESHANWQDGTNSKFKNILKIEKELENVDYVYYFDADTNISKEFTEEWFLGDLVGGEHFGNRGWLKNGAGFDRNPISHAYVPLDSTLPYTYHYGAFFGGVVKNVLKFCETLYYYQTEDKKINYEPPVNDESYINAYFHFHPPTYTVPTEKFMFDISDKGGIGETRNTKLDVSKIKQQMLENKDNLFDIANGKMIIK